jgi:hypothetical protein
MTYAARVAIAWRASHGAVPAFAMDAMTRDEREQVKRISQTMARRLLSTQPGDVSMSGLTHVIILAQGEQKRLPNLLGYPKQAIRLPGCGLAPILARTLRQIAVVTDSGVAGSTAVTVLAGPVLQGIIEGYLGESSVGFVQLATPGNSALKGIARYLEGIAYGSNPDHGPDRVVVLLGDVVYSWRCLQALLLSPAQDQERALIPRDQIVPVNRPFVFAGTSDLSTSAGELWGLSWERVAAPGMLAGLSSALEHHPPFEDYQPGQLRRWLWEMAGSDAGSDAVAELTATGAYVPIDDYTRDIDIPEHVDLIPKLSESGRAEDLEYGVHWVAQARP